MGEAFIVCRLHEDRKAPAERDRSASQAMLSKKFMWPPTFASLNLFIVAPGLPGFKELMSALHEVELQLKAGMPGSHQRKSQPGGKPRQWEEGQVPLHQHFDPLLVRSLVFADQCVSIIVYVCS